MLERLLGRIEAGRSAGAWLGFAWAGSSSVPTGVKTPSGVWWLTREPPKSASWWRSATPAGGPGPAAAVPTGRHAGFPVSTWPSWQPTSWATLPSAGPGTGRCPGWALPWGEGLRPFPLFLVVGTHLFVPSYLRTGSAKNPSPMR